jgi:hypothetical protein
LPCQVPHFLQSCPLPAAYFAGCLLVSCLAYSSTLKIEAICCSGMSVDFQRTKRRYILKAITPHKEYENFKSYIVFFIYLLPSFCFLILFVSSVLLYLLLSFFAECGSSMLLTHCLVYALTKLHTAVITSVKHAQGLTSLAHQVSHTTTTVIPYFFPLPTISTPNEKKKVKISLLQAVEAPRVARGRGSHIT